MERFLINSKIVYINFDGGELMRILPV